MVFQINLSSTAYLEVVQTQNKLFIRENQNQLTFTSFSKIRGLHFKKHIFFYANFLKKRV